MGSPILSDDGVGLFAARLLKDRIPGLSADECFITGLGLLDLVSGRDILFIVDAMIDPQRKPGDLYIGPPGRGTLHLASSHGLDFADLLELGRNSGLDMPASVTIYGITIETPVAFGETLGRALSGLLPEIVDKIEADIRKKLDMPA